MNVVEGELIGPNKLSMNNQEEKIARNSLRKFEKYDIKSIISYHGGLFNDNPNQRIKELYWGTE